MLYVAFLPFRHHGLNIWDRKRMMALELARLLYDHVEGEYPGVSMSLTNLHFTWWSIMTDEDFHHWEKKVRQVQGGNWPYYVYAEM